ncbi:MAG: type ISP restriction/modification enzyme [Tepidisphaeraceae bacterium]
MPKALQDEAITKWDIFPYVCGLLHHPGYRTKFADNLTRELPRIRFAPDFWAFAGAGDGKTLHGCENVGASLAVRERGSGSWTLFMRVTNAFQVSVQSSCFAVAAKVMRRRPSVASHRTTRDSGRPSSGGYRRASFTAGMPKRVVSCRLAICGFTNKSGVTNVFMHSSIACSVGPGGVGAEQTTAKMRRAGPSGLSGVELSRT